MKDERMMILRMLQENKITADEATNLLQALGQDPEQEDKRIDSRYGLDAETKRRVKAEIREAKADLKRALREAKLASREAMVEVRDSVRQAIEESREALEGIRGEFTGNPELARRKEEAEEKFEEAKEMLLEAMKMQEKSAGMMARLAEIEDPEKKEEIEEEARELAHEAEEMMEEAQDMAQEAEEEILDVRAEIKAQGSCTKEEAGGKVVDLGPLNEAISNITQQIGPMIAETFGGLGGATFDFKEEIVGEFEDTEKRVTVNVAVQNGAIRLYPSSDGKVHILLRKKIRGVSTKEKAEQIAKGLARVGLADNILTIEAKKVFGGRHVVDVFVALPKAVYDCNLKSVNGRIQLEHIEGGHLVATTVNGKILIDSGTAELIQAASTNGKVIASGVAPEIELRATNGKLIYEAPADAEGHITLRAVNGNILVELAEELDAEIEAKTNWGKLSFDNVSIVNEQKQMGRRYATARTLGSSSEKAALKIDAQTTNGSVRVTR